MTSDLALIALGAITTVATFAIGVAVGRQSRRTAHDDGNQEATNYWRRDAINRVAQGGAGGDQAGDLDPADEAGPIRRSTR